LCGWNKKIAFLAGFLLFFSLFSFSQEQTSSKPQDVSKPRSSFSHEIKTIVIDPGHGGLEPGAKGRFGTLEKNISLAISLKLKAIIQRNFALRVVLTREEDVDVSLENRAAKANNNKADLFISIHVNSSFLRQARGSETFFLSMEATDEDARKLAYLENNPPELEKGISSENQDDVKMILWDMAQTAYLNQSSILAESIQNELNSLFLIKSRGIKQAPFKVLCGVACPAILVEVAFISNPDEERKLRSEDFQMRIAQAMFKGLENYIAQSSEEGKR
jgi:N-acetylmuramoyl-L-alanine amidase